MDVILLQPEAYYKKIQKSTFNNEIKEILNFNLIKQYSIYLNELYIQILNSFNLNFIPIQFDSLREYKRTGCIIFENDQPVAIKINLAFIISVYYPNHYKMIIDTLYHELAHYINYIRNGLKNHGYEFGHILGNISKNLYSINNSIIDLYKELNRLNDGLNLKFLVFLSENKGICLNYKNLYNIKITINFSLTFYKVVISAFEEIRIPVNEEIATVLMYISDRCEKMKYRLKLQIKECIAS